MNALSLIVPENFIQATRDSGYKSLGSALAELVDNAFEAKATGVKITIEKVVEPNSPDVHVTVADNGLGMNRRTLGHALQFGWSSRFNKRDSHGRYGMGLPNASLSHARRVEVLSCPEGKTVTRTFLDVDEIAAGTVSSIAEPHQVDVSLFHQHQGFSKGTVVSWQKCDRLVDRKLGPLCRKLRTELGRLFRYQLWAKKSIVVNGEIVIPFDPLFIREGFNLTGAIAFGPELTFEVAIPASALRKGCSVIKVLFTELPVVEWHTKTNQEKNSFGIAKNAGVSIVRAGREIDRGWFFMGQKRKENYDDWWRCEVRFDPDLDELFGVTHTKQEIRPIEQLLEILTPDIERISRELNGRARRAFVSVKSETGRRKSEVRAERFDNLLEPPSPTLLVRKGVFDRRRGRGRVAGLQYRLSFRRLDSEILFQPELDGAKVTVVVNEAHPFVQQVWARDSDKKGDGNHAQRNVELLLLALARSELSLPAKGIQRQRIKHFRRACSNILATFLS